MGIVMWIGAVLIDTILAVYCIMTRSNQKKIRSIIYLGVFIVFLSMIAWHVIDFSLSYYPLAAFLLLQVVIGVKVLVSHKWEKAYSDARLVWKTIGRAGLYLLVTLPIILFPGHRILPPTGPYSVAVAAYTYIDPNRDETFKDTGEKRALSVEFWHPKKVDGTYPLIIFSHGGISSRTSNESLYNELASHGYVVCALDHPYHSLVCSVDGRRIFIDRNYMKELHMEDAKSHKEQSYEYYQKWMNIRTGDIHFVIDHLISETKSSNPSPIYQRIDPSKIGVMGHSLGGSAALGMGRIRDDVGAVIALESPFMCHIQGVKNGQFIFLEEAYPVPVLNIYTDSSWTHLEEWPQYAANYSLLFNTEEKVHNVYISGAGHFSITDLALTSPILTDLFNGFQSKIDAQHCLRGINRLCLAFFDCYLKDQGEFQWNGIYKAETE